jgi:hypothetical protein
MLKYIFDGRFDKQGSPIGLTGIVTQLAAFGLAFCRAPGKEPKKRGERQ